MEVRDLGEFGLIDRLRASLPQAGDLLVGPGDDAAAWIAGDRCMLATTDTMVAGVHFLPEAVSAEDVGWKALAVNVSDIVAMGGEPKHALVTLGLPPTTPVAWIDSLYAGLRECAERYRVTIAGGDIVTSPVLTITIALYGEAPFDSGRPILLRRGAARVGDVIGVMGPLGGSAAGLAVLQRGGARDDAERALVRRHMRPEPDVKITEGLTVFGFRCAIDISDGLLQDVQHICDASGVGAELTIRDIPIDPALESLPKQEARVFALTGGEDYELLLTGPPAAFAALVERHTPPAFEFGRIVKDPQHGVRVLDADGREVTFEHTGWDHLRGARGR